MELRDFHKSTTLEELLQILGCNKPFTVDGKLTVKGGDTYNKLISILDITFGICGYDSDTEVTLDDLITELDKIEWE